MSPTPPLPPGTYPARLSGWVDLGTHENRWPGQGKAKTQRRVLLTFTLFPPGPQARPARLSKEFTLSLHERAGLRKWLEAWAGRPMDEEQRNNFHPLKALEKPALLSVGSRTAADGRVWPTLAGIIHPPAGMPVPDLRWPAQHFDLGEPSRMIYAELPAWVQRKIQASQEWAGLKRQRQAERALV